MTNEPTSDANDATSTPKAGEVLDAIRQQAGAAGPTIEEGLPIPVERGNVECHLTRMDDPAYVKSWIDSPLMQKLLVPHTTASQSDTGGINELASRILDYGKAAVVGRQLCALEFTSREVVKVRMPKEGKAKKVGGDTWSINTRGQESEYVEVQPNKYFDAGDEWTQAQIEDAEYDMLMAQTGEASYNMAKLESEIIIAQMKKLQSDSGNAGKVIRGSGSGEYETATADVLLALKGRLANKNRRLRCYAMSETMYTELMQATDMKNSEYLTSIPAMYTGGDEMIAFMGAPLLHTTLMADNVIWAVDSTVALIYVLRRDNLIENYQRADAGKYGLRITTRYGLKKGRADGFAWYGA